MHRNLRTLLSLLAAAGLVGGAAVVETSTGRAVARAEAETVEARRSADVFAAPGEQSRVVTRVRAGKEMVVLKTKNRWLKVRVNGRTGWITRTNVRPVVLAEAAPRTKRRRPFVEGRSTRRGARGKAPTDRVGADATGEGFVDDEEIERDERSRRERKRAALKRKKAQERERERIEEEDEDLDNPLDEDAPAEELDDDAAEDEGEEEDEEEEERETVVVRVSRVVLHEEPSSKSDSVVRAREGARLYVVEREGDWIMVQNDDGDTGWVKASKVESASSGGYVYEKFAKRATVGLGYSTIAQNFASDGTDPRSRYRVSSGAAVIALGGEAIYDYSPKYLIAGDLTYRFYYSSPGIRYEYEDQAGNIGFKTHQIDIGARGGYKFSSKSGMAAYGRLGYHYERFGVNNVSDFTSNLAYLPSEILQGITIGGIFDMPRVTDKISVRASIDTLPILASRKQTIGLEDGSSSSTFAMWASAAVQYAWRANLKITGSYQYAYSKTSWTGNAEGSMRPHAVDSMSASRTDGSHLLLLGVGRSF